MNLLLYSSSSSSQFLQEISRYFGYSIVAEHNLRRQGMHNVQDLTVIGVTQHKGRPSLLYLTRRHKKEARINNLVQQGAMILCNSRDLYFHQLHCLLTLLDGRKAELVYLGGLKRVTRALKLCYFVCACVCMCVCECARLRE